MPERLIVLCASTLGCPKLLMYFKYSVMKETYSMNSIHTWLRHILLFMICTFHGLVGMAQQSVHSTGGDAKGIGGASSYSVGQLVYLSYSDPSGSASEGVQQIDCPGVSAPDTIGCSLSVLDTIRPVQPGGTWSVNSSFGTTVDSFGVVTLGVNADTMVIYDTIIYIISGCTSRVKVGIYPSPVANTINGGPYCSGELGHVYETGGSAVSWQWNFPSGFSSSRKNPAVSPIVPGQYSVTITDVNGCTASDTTEVCVSQIQKLCASTVDVYLNAFGQANFDPGSLLGAQPNDLCSLAGITPTTQVSFDCEDTGATGIKYTVVDSLGCGPDCITEVVVRDTISPIDVCDEVYELVLVWESSTVFPSSLASESTDNCGSQNLQFSFSEDFSTSSLTYNCREKLIGPVDLEVFVRDEAGNTSSCMITQVFTPEEEYCDCHGLDLTFSGEVPAADHKAKNTIVSNGMVSPGDTVLFKAEKSITLLPGFKAAYGSSFGARTDSCTIEGLSLDSDPFAESRAEELSEEVPTMSSAVYPNPFHNLCTLNVELAESRQVSLTLISPHGHTVRQLLTNEHLSAGNHQLTIDASRLPVGVYVLELRSGENRDIHRLVKIKP